MGDAKLTTSIPVGMPMNLGGPVTASFERTHGGHILMIADARRTEAFGSTVAAEALRGRVDVIVVDFGGLGSPLSTSLERTGSAALKRAGAALERPLGRHLLATLIREAEAVEVRLRDGRFSDRAHLIVLAGLERAPTTSPELTSAIQAILSDGPAVGIHLVLLAERIATVDRALGYGAIDSFGVRIAGPLSRDDQARTIDEPVADLHDEQLVIQDAGRGRSQVARAFAPPDERIWGAP